MTRNTSSYLQCSFVLFVLCFANSRCYAQSMLNLNEGEVCSEGDDSSSESVCRRIEDCTELSETLLKNIRPQLCSFIESTPIVCCPPSSPESQPDPQPSSRPSSRPVVLNIPEPSTAAYSAKEMCAKYSELIFNYIKPPTLLELGSSKDKTVKVRDCLDIKPLIVGGQHAKPKEFPHMVLLGYEKEPNYRYERCGGSLISKRWVLSAAHCEISGSSKYVSWARVGELDFETKIGNDIPKDYRIDKRIVHPNYNKQASRYDDIALFRLEQDVQFSPYVRPLCLNTDQSLNPPKLLASGWGKLNSDEGVSDDLQKVVINYVPLNQCRSLFNNDNGKLPRGVDDTSMICAGELKGGKDTCLGDSGGPLQISNPNYPCMYTQVGLTSFGPQLCGEKNTAGVYTRISNYISWIEPIVWPKDDE